MSDYIKREDVLLQLGSITAYKGSIPYDTAIRKIKSIKPVYIEEHQTGKWIDLNKPTHMCYPRWECSVCHFASHGGNYCPTCGAKMEKEEIEK